MNSRERLFARMKGQPVDRLPNLNIVMMFGARQMGIPYGKALNDYRLLADCMRNAQEKFHLDCLWAISDPMREAEGLGAEVVFPEDDIPYSPTPYLCDLKKIAGLKPIDPSQGRRMADRVEGVRLLAKRGGGEIPVIGWIEGAFAESCDLMGVSEVMMNVYDYPDEMTQLLKVCTEQGKRFALAQIEAGADIIGVGDAAASLIGPAQYEEFVLPYQQELIRTIHDAGCVAKLHICGNINRVLELAVQAGADMVDCDHMVDMKRAAQLAAPRGACVCGNFDPVSILLRGSTQEVRQAVRDCYDMGFGTNVMAAGCEVPKDTPPENLLAVYEELCALG
ncbi:MAG: uroporphyrinogen decarboxylase family protein [Eubacteriales bacterium]|nr:uroporphyrinogen decarboxylase family protein [Eubacteriales bacterium]